MNADKVSGQADLMQAVYDKLVDRAARRVANVIEYGDELEVARAFATAREDLSAKCDTFRATVQMDKAE